MKAITNTPASDPGEWIEWAGGECPVPADTVVQVLMRCESPERFNPEAFPAMGWSWDHEDDDASHDIIAYREVKS